MPYYKPIVSVFLLLAGASLLAGIISRALLIAFIVSPGSYLHFSGICLLFVIATSLVQLASRSNGPDGGI